MSFNENIEGNDEVFVRFKGILNRVVYSKSNLYNSPDWGIVSWVVRDVVDGDVVTDYRGCATVVGTYDGCIDPNKEYTITGKEVENEKYGKQYELVCYSEAIDFSDVKNQRGFLKTFLTDLQIEEFYKIYKNPLEVIESGDEEALKKVHGVGNVIAKRIIRDYEGLKDLSQVYIELDRYGLTTNFISKLIQTYHSPQKILSVVKENPYQLVADVDGVGFATADKIALRGGFAPTAPERIMAYIIWFLGDQCEVGNSYMLAGELMASIYNDLGGKEAITAIVQDKEGNEVNNIAYAIRTLQDNGTIVVEEGKAENKSQRRVYLTKIYRLEREIAYHLKRLLEAKNEFEVSDEEMEERIETAEEIQGFKFTQEQRDGIKLGVEKQVCLISGLAGTGKSSLVNGILTVLQDYNFAQCALSGKAAARLREVTGQEGYTIHRLLGFKGGFFSYTEDNHLPFDIIVLDEISLVGGEIFLDLLQAIPTGSKLIMLGDMGQLEAIGALNLAADMFASHVIPTVDLQQVHRQALNSGILSTAYDARHQKQIYKESDHEGVDVRGNLQDMLIDCAVDKKEDRDKVVEYFARYWNSKLVNHDLSKIQVISPVKERGESCVYNLNLDIQEYLNPEIPGKKFVSVRHKGGVGDYDIRVGDKVMCVKNHYNISDVDGGTTDIFNGWTGVVEDIDERGIIVNFDMGYRPVVVSHKDVNTHLILGYASTLHKLQGSSADVIVGVVDYSTPPMMLTCQLVYTLLTRAKKMCVLVAQTKALSYAISNNKVSEKRTFLCELLEEGLKDLQAIHFKERKERNQKAWEHAKEGVESIVGPKEEGKQEEISTASARSDLSLLGGLTASSGDELDLIEKGLEAKEEYTGVENEEGDD